MLSDPLILVRNTPNVTAAQFTSGGTATSWVRTGSALDKSTYRYTVDTDTWYDLTVGHQYGNRRRFIARIDEHDVVENPLDTTKNVVKSSSLYIVHDLPIAMGPTSINTMAATLSHFLVTGADFTRLLDRVVTGEL